ncbi:MAG: FAD-binding oxidoreductase [Bdellovibrionota bacterium]
MTSHAAHPLTVTAEAADYQRIADIQSWTRFSKQQHWLCTPSDEFAIKQAMTTSLGSTLPVGRFKSYSDCGLNPDGGLISSRKLNRILSFDPRTGVLECEPGATWRDVLSTTLQHGWALPTSPATQYVTLGGAVANDIHGRNQHAVGNFGHYVEELQLLQSNGDSRVCSPIQNPDLFRATIGGIGLTGFILRIRVQLVPHSGLLNVSSLRFRGLYKALELCDELQDRWEYIAVWFDLRTKH